MQSMLNLYLNIKKILEERKYLYIVLMLIVVFLSLNLRISLIDKIGGDQKTYKQAVTELYEGINPYEYTVKSFTEPGLKHGYAYLPSLLYIQYFFFYINTHFDLDLAMHILWRIPVFIADYLVAYLIFTKFKEKDKLFAIFSTAIWLFNPHILFRSEYTLYEPLSILFLLLALNNVSKSSLKSGLFYAISLSFKTFGLILLPLFLIRANNKIKFIVSGLVFGLIISIPFMTNLYDLNLYIQGSLLVHGERGIQGRPILTFLTYYLFNNSKFAFQQIFASVFSILALILPWIYIIKKKGLNIYYISTIAFGLYYLITPVLNRTHLLWFLPIFLIASGSNEISKGNILRGYFLVGLWFIVSSIYLKVWDKGFHIYGTPENYYIGF